MISHNYHGLKLEVIWDAARIFVPTLKAAVEHILATDPGVREWAASFSARAVYPVGVLGTRSAGLVRCATRSHCRGDRPQEDAPVTRLLVPLTLVATLAVASCSDTTAPDSGTLRPDEVRLASGLAIAVTATPNEVRPGDSVTVRVTVRNPSSATLRVQSGCTALAGITLDRFAPPAVGNGPDTDFSTVCGQAITIFTLAPGDSVVSAVRAPTTSLRTGAPLPAGTYYVGAYSHVGTDVLIGPADGQVANASTTLVLR